MPLSLAPSAPRWPPHPCHPLHHVHRSLCCTCHLPALPSPGAETILLAGYNIASLMLKYRGVDFRDRHMVGGQRGMGRSWVGEQAGWLKWFGGAGAGEQVGW